MALSLSITLYGYCTHDRIDGPFGGRNPMTSRVEKRVRFLRCEKHFLSFQKAQSEYINSIALLRILTFRSPCQRSTFVQQSMKAQLSSQDAPRSPSISCFADQSSPSNGEKRDARGPDGRTESRSSRVCAYPANCPFWPRKSGPPTDDGRLATHETT